MSRRRSGSASTRRKPGSLPLGSLAGIGLHLHWTFALLVVFVVWSAVVMGLNVESTVRRLGLLVTVFACVVLHELGHALTARRFGVVTRDITLYPIGGISSMDRLPERPSEELQIAIAGPAVSLGIALVGALSMLLVRVPVIADVLPAAIGPAVGTLTVINLVLGVFNLIPAFPTDGGRVLRALLATRLDHAMATRIAADVGKGMAILLGVLGLFGNWLLVVIAVFLVIGAEREARTAETLAALSDVRSRDVMTRSFAALGADWAIGDAADALLAGPDRTFPVVDDDGALVGVVARAALLEALGSGRATAPLRALIPGQAATVTPDDPVAEAVRRMWATGDSAIPVVHGGQLVGMVSARGVQDWMEVRDARRGADAPAHPTWRS